METKCLSNMMYLVSGNDTTTPSLSNRRIGKPGYFTRINTCTQHTACDVCM